MTPACLRFGCLLAGCLLLACDGSLPTDPEPEAPGYEDLRDDRRTGVVRGDDDGDTTTTIIPPGFGAVALGQVFMAQGPLVGATVSVYDPLFPDAPPVWTSTEPTQDSTDVETMGTFFLPASSITSGDFDALFLIRATGGQVVPLNENGEPEGQTANFAGSVRLLARRATMLRNDESGNQFVFKMNPLTELAYQRTKWMISAGYSSDEVVARLDAVAQDQIFTDVIADGTIDRLDMVAFQPHVHRAVSYRGSATAWEQLGNAIRTSSLANAAGMFSGARVLGSATFPGVDPVDIFPDTPSAGLGVAVYGDYAYVAASLSRGDGLYIIDISDPAAPQLLNTVAAPGNPDGGTALPAAQDVAVAMVGGRLWACVTYGFTDPLDVAPFNARGAVQIIDVTDPANIPDPRLVSSISPDTGFARGISIHAGRAYASFGTRGAIVDSVEVIDIVSATSADAPASINTGRQKRAGTGASVMDVTSTTSALAIFPVQGRRVLFIANGLAGLDAFDLDATEILPRGLVLEEAGLDTIAVARQGAGGANVYAYMTTSEGNLVAVDVTDILSTDTDALPYYRIETPGFAHGIALDGDLAYVADGDNGVQVVDITDPTSMQLLQVLRPSGLTVINEVTIAEGQVYASEEQGRLHVMDPGAAEFPALVDDSQRDVLGFGGEIRFNENTGYMTSATAGLQFFDTTLLSDQGRFGLCELTSPCDTSLGVAESVELIRVTRASRQALATTSLYAWVAYTTTDAPASAAAGLDPSSAIDIIDIPADLATSNPVRVGRLPIVARIDQRDSALSGIALISHPDDPDITYGYLAQGASGLRAVKFTYEGNVEVPGAEELLSFGPTLPDLDPGVIPDLAPTFIRVRDVAVTSSDIGSYLYVAAGRAGIRVFDIADPEAPVLANPADASGAPPVGGSAEGLIALRDDLASTETEGRVYLYVAAGDAGLQVIRADITASGITLTAQGALDTPGYASDVSVHVVRDGSLVIRGMIAYVADGARGVQMIDVGDPTNLVLRGEVSMPGIISRVGVHGNPARVYAGGGTAGVSLARAITPRGASVPAYDTDSPSPAP